MIRAGAQNDEGFQYDGIDATEPVTGQFINSLVLNGVSRLVLSTGGYDVTNGNTNSGVVNVVIKRGAYPGAGEATALMNYPNFDHRLAFDFGNATPDNRFSYYFSFTGNRTTGTSGARLLTMRANSKPDSGLSLPSHGNSTSETRAKM